jgi:hypothetical protein
MSITSSSMLVELSISVWTANKIDRDATQKVTHDNNATADAGQFKKNLMAGSTMRKGIADYAAGCRLWHNTRTLPWADRGPRLLPTSLFLDYKQEASARQDFFNTKVDEFRQAYPRLVSTASNYLGTLFNPDDYPSVDEVMSKFGFRMVFSPVPESGDFRLDLPQQEIAELGRSYEQAFEARVADAMREPWTKLHDMLGNMSAKLTDSGEDVKKRWHDSFITNAQEMCAMLTHLNITKDSKLEEARRDLERAIAGVEIDDIKEDAGVREDVKTKLDNILGQYDW